ncbi:hypothetical protein MY11210_009634 [Beauveria gryllotalpidicola]
MDSKRSGHLSLATTIRQYINAKYDQHPDMFRPDLEAIDTLQTDAINVSEPHFEALSVRRVASLDRWQISSQPDSYTGRSKNNDTGEIKISEIYKQQLRDDPQYNKVANRVLTNVAADPSTQLLEESLFIDGQDDQESASQGPWTPTPPGNQRDSSQSTSRGASRGRRASKPPLTLTKNRGMQKGYAALAQFSVLGPSASNATACSPTAQARAVVEHIAAGADRFALISSGLTGLAAYMTFRGRRTMRFPHVHADEAAAAAGPDAEPGLAMWHGARAGAGPEAAGAVAKGPEGGR